MQWLKANEPSPTKYLSERSKSKSCDIVFWDVQGVILVHMVEMGCTIFAEYYANFLESELARAIRMKRPRVRANQVLYQHDNARPYTSQKTRDAIDRLG